MSCRQPLPLVKLVKPASLLVTARSWEAAPPLEGELFNECMIAALPNRSIVHISRKALPHRPYSYGIVTYAPDLRTRGPIRTLAGIDTPTCEGSLVFANGALYFANPSSQLQRWNMTIHKSTDGGDSEDKHVQNSPREPTLTQDAAQAGRRRA